MFRKGLFWITDTLRGGKIAKHFKDLKWCENNIFEKASLERLKWERLENLLYNARTTTNFYSSRAKKPMLSAFPVIDKTTIRSKFDEFISQDYNKSKLKEAVTSGSTGSPLKVLQDRGKIKRNTADTIFFGIKAKFWIGEPLVYAKIWNEINQKNQFVQKAQNIIPLNVINLSKESLSSFVNHLNKFKNKLTFLGYPSAIEKMASYVLENPKEKKFLVKSIITMSEAISSGGRELMREAFSCPVYSRYSNVENGIIAQECDDLKEGFLINSPSYHVEILELDSDVPVEEGQIGRIVVTDLFNYGMPIIRYDTGDIGAMETVETSNGVREVLSRVEGRRMDAIYNNKNELVSSFIITNEMWKYPELLQYQFIQKGQNEYEFRLNTDESFNRENELIDHFKEFLGKDTQINVTYVEEIPLLNSGKRKKVVNEMQE
jgi:phenylacetate-CoA ligase